MELHNLFTWTINLTVRFLNMFNTSKALRQRVDLPDLIMHWKLSILIFQQYKCQKTLLNGKIRITTRHDLVVSNE